ncbi:MAG: cytochrome C oxidase subunit IV family protein [Planctomycetota bacterium]
MSHSHGNGDHAHHVSSPFTLVLVLVILMILTALTFIAYFVEIWISEAFGVYIPQWVNVLVAMSIATVKGTLVLMYFMHLRHDNQLNTVILVSCVAAFAIFLGFTGLDLGNRGTIFAWKDGPIIEGGTSVGSLREIEVIGADGETSVRGITSGVSVAQFAKDPTIAGAVLGSKHYEKLVKKHDAEHGYHDHNSSSEHSRPRTGLTAGLFAAEAPVQAGHGHGDHGGDDHSEAESH